MKEKYESGAEKMTKPEYWGGFRVIPRNFEFWQGQSTRIHDRIVFRLPRDNEIIDDNLTQKGLNGWLIERLSP